MQNNDSTAQQILDAKNKKHTEELQKKAELDYQQGLKYCFGNGIAKNLSKAKEHLHKAAEFGHASAQYFLGDFYETGVHVPKNYVESTKWYARAAEHKDYLDAKYKFAQCLINGQGIDKNLKKGMDLMLEIANRNHPSSQYFLGDSYEHGKHGIQNFVESTKWYARAAEHDGYLDAKYKFTLCYKSGQGIPQDTEKAINLFCELATKKHVQALNQLMQYDSILVTKPDDRTKYVLADALKQVGIPETIKRSRALYEELANNNHPVGLEESIQLHAHGTEVARDSKKMLAWCETLLTIKNDDRSKSVCAHAFRQAGTPETIKRSISLYEELADNGHPAGLDEAIQLHDHGVEVERNPQKIINWCTKYLARNDDRSKHVCASALRKAGTQEAIKKSTALYEELADNGHVTGLEESIKLHTRGVDVTKDLKKLIRWGEKLVAINKDGRSKCILAISLREEGTSESLKRAATLFEESSNDGYFSAYTEIARCYEKGIGLEKNPKRAAEWLLLKSAHAGDNASQIELARCFEEGNGRPTDYSKAAYWYEKSISTTSDPQIKIESEYNLACCLELMRGPANYKKAAEHFLKLAKNGYTPAFADIASYLKDGLGITRDLTEAVAWYEKAVAAGDVYCFLSLAECLKELSHFQETGDQKNHSENQKANSENQKKRETYLKQAAIYFEKAASAGSAGFAGSATAQYEVAMCYENGKGVKKDLKAALRWYELAAKRFHKDLVYSWATTSRDLHQKCLHRIAEIEYIEDAPKADNLMASGKFKEAARYYEKSAEKGNAKSQYLLATCLLKMADLANEEHSSKKESEHSRNNASEHNRKNESENSKKSELENSHSEAKANREKAYAWFESAALAGYVSALEQMPAYSIQESQPLVPPVVIPHYPNTLHNSYIERALAWRELAATRGVSEAQYQLALHLMPQNHSEAAGWLELASLQNHPEARKNLAELRSRYPNLNIIHPDLNLNDEAQKARHDKLIRTISYGDVVPRDGKEPSTSRHELLLAAKKYGFSVSFDVVPIAGERIAYSSIKSGNAYQFTVEHWDPYLQQKITISKKITDTELESNKGKPVTLCIPGREETTVSLDKKGLVSFSILEHNANIAFSAEGAVRVSEIRRPGKIHLQTDTDISLNLTRVHSAGNVGLEVHKINYDEKTFCVSGSLDILFKKSHNIMQPIFNPGSLRIIFAENSFEANALMYEFDAELNYLLSKEWEAEVEAAANTKDTANLKASKDSKTTDSKATPDFKTAADGKISNLKNAYLKAAADKVARNKEKNDKVSQASLQPIQILANINVGAKNSKEAADITIITGDYPVNMGSETGPYITISSTGKANLAGQNFDLVKGKVIGQQNTVVLSQNDIITGRLDQAKISPSGILSSAEVILSANKKIKFEGSEIYGGTGLRFRSPIVVDNIANRIISDGSAHFDTPKFDHRMLIEIEKYNSQIRNGWRGVTTYSSNKQEPFYCYRIHESIKIYLESVIAKSDPAYMRVKNNFTLSGEMNSLGSSVHFGKYIGKMPDIKNVEVKTIWVHKALSGHEYRHRSHWSYHLKNDPPEKIYQALFSSANNLVLSGDNNRPDIMNITGIIFAPGIDFFVKNGVTLGYNRTDFQLPTAKRFNPIIQLPIINSPRFEYQGTAGDTIFRSVLSQRCKMYRPPVVILNTDGSLGFSPIKRNSMLPTEMEEEALVTTLLDEYKKGILDKKTTEPSAMVYTLLTNAWKVLDTGRATAGLDSNGIPKWYPGLRRPLMVYKEMNVNGEFKLWPHVIVPLSWNKNKLRDWAGGYFSLEDINIVGLNNQESRIIITAHLDAKGVIRFRKLKSVTHKKAAYIRNETVAETTVSESCAGLKRSTQTNTKTITHVTPQAGNTVNAKGVSYKDIDHVEFNSAEISAGEKGISASNVNCIEGTTVAATSVMADNVSAESYINYVEHNKFRTEYTIHPTILNSQGGIHLNTNRDQSYDSTQMRAVQDINLNGHDVRLGSRTVAEDLPTMAHSKGFSVTVITGHRTKGLPSSLVSLEGSVNCNASGTIYLVGTEMLAFIIELNAAKGITAIPLILEQWYRSASEGFRGLSYFSQKQEQSHESGIVPRFFAHNNLKVKTETGNIFLVAPVMCAGNTIELVAPKGTVFLKPQDFHHDITSTELTVGLSFFGSQFVEGLIQKDFKRAVLGLLREIPLLASMEELLKEEKENGATVGSKIGPGMKALYYSYKLYKDFAQNSLKDFAAKQLDATVNLRFGTSETQQSWTDLALPWLQARNIVITAKNLYSSGTQVDCKNFSAAVDENITIEQAEQRARYETSSQGATVGYNVATNSPSLGLDFSIAEQQSIEHINSHFKVSGTTSLKADGKISLGGVFIKTLKAVIDAAQLELKTVQDEHHSSNISASASTTGSASVSAGKSDSKYAKEQTGIFAKETLLANIKEEIRLVGAKLEVGRQAKPIAAKLPDGNTLSLYELALPEVDSLLSATQLSFDSIVKHLHEPKFAAELNQLQTHFALSIWSGSLPEVLQNDQTRTWKKRLTENAENWDSVIKGISEKVQKETLAKFLILKLASLNILENDSDKSNEKTSANSNSSATPSPNAGTSSNSDIGSNSNAIPKANSNSGLGSNANPSSGTKANAGTNSKSGSNSSSKTDPDLKSGASSESKSSLGTTERLKALNPDVNLLNILAKLSGLNIRIWTSKEKEPAEANQAMPKTSAEKSTNSARSQEMPKASAEKSASPPNPSAAPPTASAAPKSAPSSLKTSTATSETGAALPKNVANETSQTKTKAEADFTSGSRSSSPSSSPKSANTSRPASPTGANNTTNATKTKAEIEAEAEALAAALKVYRKQFVLETTGDGDCSLHALLGEWNNQKNGLYCLEIAKRKKELGNAIRRLRTNEQPCHKEIFEITMAAIEDMLHSHSTIFTGLRAAQKQYNSTHKKLADEAWTTLEKTLKNGEEAHEKILKYITDFTKEKDFKNFTTRFQTCLNTDSDKLKDFMVSTPCLRKPFEEYNNASRATFNIPEYILQNNNVLEEYAQHVETMHRHLSTNELHIAALVFNVHVRFISFHSNTIGHTIVTSFNPNGSRNVGIAHNGGAHFERLKAHYLSKLIANPELKGIEEYAYGLGAGINAGSSPRARNGINSSKAAADNASNKTNSDNLNSDSSKDNAYNANKIKQEQDAASKTSNNTENKTKQENTSKQASEKETATQTQEPSDKETHDEAALEFFNSIAVDPNAETLHLKYSEKNKCWSFLHDQPGYIRASSITGEDVINRKTSTQAGMNANFAGIGNMFDSSSTGNTQNTSSGSNNSRSDNSSSKGNTSGNSTGGSNTKSAGSSNTNSNTTEKPDPVQGTVSANFQTKEKNETLRASVLGPVTKKTNSIFNTNSNPSETRTTTKDESFNASMFAPIGNPTKIADDVRNTFNNVPEIPPATMPKQENNGTTGYKETRETNENRETKDRKEQNKTTKQSKEKATGKPGTSQTRPPNASAGVNAGGAAGVGGANVNNGQHRGANSRDQVRAENSNRQQERNNEQSAKIKGSKAGSYSKFTPFSSNLSTGTFGIGAIATAAYNRQRKKTVEDPTVGKKQTSKSSTPQKERQRFSLPSQLPASHSNVWFNEACRIGRVIERSRDNVADTILHPIETIKESSTFIWDLAGAASKMVFGTCTADSQVRNKERLTNITTAYDAFVQAPCHVKSEILLEVGLTGFLGSSLGMFSGAGTRASVASLKTAGREAVAFAETRTFRSPIVFQYDPARLNCGIPFDLIRVRKPYELNSNKKHVSYLEKQLGVTLNKEHVDFLAGAGGMHAYENFAKAREQAKIRANLGNDAVPFLQKIGPYENKIYTGMQSKDGTRGWRVDFDPKNPKTTHINWWYIPDAAKQKTRYKGMISIENATQDIYWDILSHFPKRQMVD